jgi:hypothetical protein
LCTASTGSPSRTTSWPHCADTSKEFDTIEAIDPEMPVLIEEVFPDLAAQAATAAQGWAA